MTKLLDVPLSLLISVNLDDIHCLNSTVETEAKSLPHCNTNPSFYSKVTLFKYIGSLNWAGYFLIIQYLSAALFFSH